MQFEKYFKSFLMIAALMLIITSPLYATSINPNIDPFGYFNVYSLNDIMYSASDFQGTTGAAGNFNVTKFTLYNLEGNEYALHTGGSASYKSGSIGPPPLGEVIPLGGSIEVNANVNLGNFTLYDGNIYSGGNVNDSLLGGGTINGNVYAAGAVNFLGADGILTVNGIPYPGTEYSPIADHDLISQYFLDYSALIGLMEDTDTIINYYGSLTINAVSGINVFSIDALTFLNAGSVTINGPSDAIVYINVDGVTTTLNSTTWVYNGVPTGNVLLNYWQASSLTYTSSNKVNLLAPMAVTTYNGGVHTGNLIVGDLSGSGQVNLGHFSAPPTEGTPAPVPEPATMLLFGTGLLGLATRMRRKSPKPRMFNK